MLGTARTVSRATISVRATAVLRDNNNRRRDQISGRRRPCSGDRRRLLVTNYVPTPSRLKAGVCVFGDFRSLRQSGHSIKRNNCVADDPERASNSRPLMEPSRYSIRTLQRICV